MILINNIQNLLYSGFRLDHPECSATLGVDCEMADQLYSF